MAQPHPANATSINHPGAAQALEGFPALDQLQTDLDDVTRALERLDEGSYGTCQTCGGPLDDELLAANPTVRVCPDCPSG